MEPAALQTLSRQMVGTDRIVRTEGAHPKRLQKVILDVTRLLHQPTEGSLCIGTSCVKENTEVLGLGIRVDPLSNGARGIAAAHRERLNQQMRECVQKHVRSTRKWALALPVFSPALVSPCKCNQPLTHRGCAFAN